VNRSSAQVGSAFSPGAGVAAQFGAPREDRPAVDVSTFASLLDLIGLRRSDEFIAHIGSDLDTIGRRIDEAADRDDRRALSEATHALAGLAATLGAERLSRLARHPDAARAPRASLRLFADRLEAEIAAVRSACARLADARRPI